MHTSIPQMKNLFILSAILLVQLSARSQSTLTLDKVHSKVGFTVTHHMISEMELRLTGEFDKSY